MTSIVDLIYSTKHKAEGVRRRSDGVLYSVLADCLAIVERCSADATDKDSLRLLFAQRPPPAGQKRHYVEKKSDDFQIVCRLVFDEGQSYANLSRYAIAIRQAFSRGIRAADLVAWIGTNGGINELYLSRPLDADRVRTKCLRLNSGIVVEKGKPFTVTLLRLENNTYTVVSSDLE